MATPISILTEIPEELHASMCSYLDTHPQWDQDKVITVALSLFFLNSEVSSASPASESEAQPANPPAESREPIAPTWQLTPIHQTCARVYLETLFQT